MKVLLAGATGVVGRALIPQLVAAGHTVIALSRSEQALRELAAPPVQTVAADILDREGLLRALDGRSADAIVHHATAIHGTPMRHNDLAATDELRDVGTRHLLAAREMIGATKIVSQSFYLGYG